MTKAEIRKCCSKGLSEDRDGEFYTIYDFDKICQLITEEFKGIIQLLCLLMTFIVALNMN